jgi:hypothetical protein
MHASEAAALFAAPGDEDEGGEGDRDGDGDVEDDVDGGRGLGGAELDVDGWYSRGGSPDDEGDEDAIAVRHLLLSTEAIY